MCKTSTPGFWFGFFKPVCLAIELDSQVNKLMDFYENYNNDDASRNKAYSKALNLAKRSNCLLGYSKAKYKK
jgi:hypothetical protein